MSTTPITTSDRPVGHAGARVEVNERGAFAVDGFLALAVGIGLLAFAIWRIVSLIRDATATRFAETDPPVAAILVVVAAVVLLVTIASSLVVISPGESRVVQFFGRYVGTARRTGLTLLLPLTTKRSVSVRVNNFETHTLKVNDAAGNPVEIGAIVVWQVADTARATFAVESYQQFVAVQSEAALRHVATSHPYDDAAGAGTSLRGSTDVVSAELAHEVAERVTVAGVEIVEVRISHLAYSPEIAQAMLQRQQAAAIISARSLIVDGAVGMVQQALARLDEQGIVALDDERRAAMISNLLVVLCGDSRATPVVNTGTLYG